MDHNYKKKDLGL